MRLRVHVQESRRGLVCEVSLQFNEERQVPVTKVDRGGRLIGVDLAQRMGSLVKAVPHGVQSASLLSQAPQLFHLLRQAQEQMAR